MLKIKGARRIEKIRFYPFSCKQHLNQQRGKYQAIVGLGANIDAEKARFVKLFRLLMDDKRFKVLQTSSLLINKAFGYEAQKDFTNAVIWVQTPLHARALLKVLLFYEFKFRRKRTFKNAARSLDLDLLYFNSKVKADSKCLVPHPEAHKRISVILPLGEF